MANSPNAVLPYLDAAQAQKHVTVNDAIRRLDATVSLAVTNRTLATPPGSPAEGDRYLVAASPTGAWAGKAAQIAFFADGVWDFLAPRAGWQVYVVAEGLSLAFDGTSWGYSVRSPKGASTALKILEEEVTVAGATTSTTIAIPNRAIVLGVSVRTTVAITGASSFNAGVSGNASQFGGSLGIAVGSTNIGVIGPTAFYANTPVLLTAVGSSFTGGKVRVAIHYLDFTAPAA